jgi:isopentenyl-diphosphate Delta-isomerase
MVSYTVMTESYFDVIDEHDEPTNQVASYNEVHAKGLWVRGVHVIIYTPDYKIVMQKRAPSLRYHPGEIEVSVGGGVDAGETPEQAAIRETKEEFGIILQPSDLRFLGKTKFNHRSKGQINRNFVYSYAACIPAEKLILTINPEETTLAFTISRPKLRRALIKHRIKHFGKISSQYAYWRFLLESI